MAALTEIIAELRYNTLNSAKREVYSVMIDILENDDYIVDADDIHELEKISVRIELFSEPVYGLTTRKDRLEFLGRHYDDLNDACQGNCHIRIYMSGDFIGDFVASCYEILWKKCLDTIRVTCLDFGFDEVS